MEDIRHKLSAFLMDSPENPLVVDIILDGGSYFGLSASQTLSVESIFKDNEGTIWFKLTIDNNPIKFDDMPESWLDIIIEELNIK